MAKRKSISEFFLPQAKKAASDQGGKPCSTPLEHKEVAFKSPPGLSVIESFLTTEEESSLLSYLDSSPWRTDLSRRTMHFGGSYCLMPARNSTPEQRKAIEQTIIQAPPMPKQLDFLVERMVQKGLYRDKMRPAYCIVNEYLPGLGISAHVENFRFGEPVCSLTLAGPDTMRFHEMESANDGSVRSGKAMSAPKTGRWKDIAMVRRSMLILRGDARSTWQHEIRRTKASSKPLGWRRVSLTFRVDRDGGSLRLDR